MKKICVITATRAEYGLLSSVIREINNDAELKLLLIATGMHLDKNYGETYKEIDADGFNINYKLQINESSNELGILNTIANGVTRVGAVLYKEKPDAIIMLGDRYELLAFASAAVVLRIPIIHISGGEITEGAIDEYIRHSVTKMSTLHFVSTEAYRSRVIQMGEHPDRVFNVGDLGIANVKELRHISKEELQKVIRMNIGNSLVQVTFHPETLSDNYMQEFENLLEVLEKNLDLQIVFTKANADLGGREINERIDVFVKRNRHRARAFYSLGYNVFLNLLRYSIGIIGNSSSGIVEAPSLKIGTVNIGDRQKGRIRAESVIDCAGNKEEISDSIKKLRSAEYRQMLLTVRNPYESENTACQIVQNLKDFLLKNDNNIKLFYDLYDDNRKRK